MHFADLVHQHLLKQKTKTYIYLHVHLTHELPPNPEGPFHTWIAPFGLWSPVSGLDSKRAWGPQATRPGTVVISETFALGTSDGRGSKFDRGGYAGLVHVSSNPVWHRIFEPQPDDSVGDQIWLRLKPPSTPSCCLVFLEPQTNSESSVFPSGFQLNPPFKDLRGVPSLNKTAAACSVCKLMCWGSKSLANMASKRRTPGVLSRDRSQIETKLGDPQKTSKNNVVLPFGPRKQTNTDHSKGPDSQKHQSKFVCKISLSKSKRSTTKKTQAHSGLQFLRTPFWLQFKGEPKERKAIAAVGSPNK